MQLISMANFFPQAGQTMKFDVISIVFVVILLIAILINIKRGFVGALIAFCAGFGSLIAAILLCKPVGTALYQTSMGSGLYDSVFSWVANLNGGILNTTMDAATMETMLPEAYEAMNIPEILHQTLTNILTPMITEEGVNLAEAISESLATYTLIIASFIVIWLVLFIVFKILGRFAKKINKVPFLGFVNRLLGGVFGLLTGTLTCFIICYCLSFFFSMNLPFGETLSGWLALNDDSVWTLSKALYENNFIQKLIEMYL